MKVEKFQQERFIPEIPHERIFVAVAEVANLRQDFGRLFRGSVRIVANSVRIVANSATSVGNF